MSYRLGRYKRECSAVAAYGVLLLVVAVTAPAFFSAANGRDLLLSQAPVLVAAVGMTLVILVGHIDVSTGAQFALASIAAGGLAKTGLAMPWLMLSVAAIGGLMGAGNGALVAGLGIPSIVVTLAAMVALRDALRWITQGSWVQNLPDTFQWFGLGQAAGQAAIVLDALLIWAGFAWGLRNGAAGRALYAIGSDEEAARLAGIRPPRVVFAVFVLNGVLVGLAALLNTLRFSDVQSNAGVGLEMKAIAAVVVGGTAITGGRGTLVGTLIGVALLGTIGTALTFMGINPFWEKAVQGTIILAAVASDAVTGRKAGRVKAQGVTHG